MKNYIFISALFLTHIISFSQTNESVLCNTHGILHPEENFNRNTILPETYDATTPYVINAFFTLVNDQDNNNALTYNAATMNTPVQIENAFLDCIKNLNIAYNPSKIYFKYTGYQIVQCDHIFSTFFQDSEWQFLLPYKQTDALNFYVLNSNSNQVMGGTESVIPLSSFSNGASWHAVLVYYLIHAVGHNLSLYHTYETGSHYIGTPLEATTLCERVTRNQGDAWYNADIAGDEVEDTPAEPAYLSASYFTNCSNYINPTGPEFLNCWNEPYENIIYGNYMSASSNINSPCWHFTAGQILRMREFIQFNSLAYNYSSYPTVRNDVSSLYQPFHQNVFAGNIVTTQDQPDSGGAIVCRELKMKERFQPGFDYVFSDTTFGPTFPQNINQQFNYDEIPDHSIGVQIPALSGNIINIGSFSNLMPICIFEPYVSGMLYSTAALGSMNISIEELSTIRVRDPKLYDNLMTEYYYILKKQTESGAKTELIFYKY